MQTLIDAGLPLPRLQNISLLASVKVQSTTVQNPLVPALPLLVSQHVGLTPVSVALINQQ